MKTESIFSIEDTFFGAILGAILGLLVANLTIWYVAIIISFFIIFPSILRRAEAISGNHQSLILLLGFGWMLILVVDLIMQSLISLNNGLVFFGVFFGWLVSLFTRTLSR